MKKSRFLILFVLLLFMLGCVTDKDFSLLEQQVEKNRILLNAQRKAIEKKLKDLEKRIALLEEKIEKETHPIRSTQADLWSDIQRLKEEIAEVKNSQEVMDYKISQSITDLETKLNKNIEDFESRFSLLKEDVEKIKKELAVEFSVKRKNNKVSLTKKDPQSIYKKALYLFKKRKYESAIKILEVFIKKFPKHYLIPNAYFWQGESYFMLKKYPQAILKYQMVIEKYPKSSKYRVSLLKQGICFFKINKKVAGKIVLEKLIKEYPKSEEAKRARLFLKGQK